jgi:hypothetical protein
VLVKGCKGSGIKERVRRRGCGGEVLGGYDGRAVRCSQRYHWTERYGYRIAMS